MEPEGSLYVHETPLLDSTLSQIKPVHIFIPYFSKTHFNIIFPMPTSSEWSRPFRFANQNIVCISHLSHVCSMPRPSHPSWLDHPNNIR